jgi:hypothetical protein
MEYLGIRVSLGVKRLRKRLANHSKVNLSPTERVVYLGIKEKLTLTEGLLIKNMALKRRYKDGTIKYVSYKQDDDKTRIKRLEALLRELTQTLAEIVGYNDKPIAAASSYDCYK